MEIVLVSNALNHHQIPLCEALMEKSDSFYFVATKEEGKFGYQIVQDAEYVMHYFDDEKSSALEKICEADVVIFGDCPTELIEKRMHLNKLSFIYSERLFKKGLLRRFIPTTYKKIFNRFLKFKNKNLYILCASGYLKNDLSAVHFPVEKCFKWGYFPKVSANTEVRRSRCSNEISLLWAGRLLDWKHPEMAVTLAEHLIGSNVKFNITIVGDGPMNPVINSMIDEKHLEEYVHCVGSKSTVEVYELMTNADIFLGTSDKGEGWGAVINEAMNCGCIVVASNGMGAAPFLINDGENGFIFKENDQNELNKIIDDIAGGVYDCGAISQRAIETIEKLWNADKAAENFTKLVEKYNDSKFEFIPELGPCSLA